MDLDPQGNATQGLGFDAGVLDVTIATVIRKMINKDYAVCKDYGILHHEEGIDLVPSNIELSIDDLMTVCLADNFGGVELILRIILRQEDIKIKSVRTQELMKNLQGRSAILDVHAMDSKNKEFDVEIQRADKGAGVKRARYFKQDKEGVATMCKMMEDMRNEAAQKVFHE